MNAPTLHPDHDDATLEYVSHSPANFGHKLRPASHTFHREEGSIAWTLLTLALSALLVLAALWLIRLLG